ncbi:hypothetical protein JW905_03360, partial [bacterium]|nr:hypothetical protein [candidate division CSSED10-310 bacterium]
NHCWNILRRGGFRHATAVRRRRRLPGELIAGSPVVLLWMVLGVTSWCVELPAWVAAPDRAPLAESQCKPLGYEEFNGDWQASGRLGGAGVAHRSLEVIPCPPCPGHPLGTDGRNRDLLRLIHHANRAYFPWILLVPVITVIFGAALGVGSRFPFQWRWIRPVCDGISQLLGSIPRLLGVLLVLSALGRISQAGGYTAAKLWIVTAIFFIPKISERIKARIQTLQKESFIEALQSLGLTTRVIVFRHILLANCGKQMVIDGTNMLAQAFLMEALLSYLGFGIQSPAHSLATVAADNLRFFMRGSFSTVLYPMLVLIMYMFGLFLFGDGLARLWRQPLR